MSQREAPDDSAKGSEDAGAEPKRVRGRHREVQLWDDAGFRQRVQRIAQERGFVLADVMRAAGVAIDYTYRPSDSRSSNVIMRLAMHLGVTPAELAGWTAEPSPPVVPEPVLRSLERQHRDALLIVGALARGDSLIRIADTVGIDRKGFSALIREALDDRPSG